MHVSFTLPLFLAVLLQTDPYPKHWRARCGIFKGAVVILG